jgi:hypothetical protein
VAHCWARDVECGERGRQAGRQGRTVDGEGFGSLGYLVCGCLGLGRREEM